jgi:hypothetical protein
MKKKIYFILNSKQNEKYENETNIRLCPACRS